MRNLLLCLCALMLLNMIPAPAYAADALCPTLYDDNNGGVTKAVTTCVEAGFKDRAVTLRSTLQGTMNSVFNLLMVLACAFFGIKMMGGKARGGEAAAFFMRIAVAYYLFHGAGGMIAGMIHWPGEFSATATGSDPWSKIDEFLGLMLGIGVNFSIGSGVLGIVSGALFSSTFGIVLFFAGLKAVLDIVFFIVQAIFVYLSAVTLVSFLVVISPIILPFALFFYTEKYVRSWANCMVAAIITPMLLFICLNAFMDLFKFLVEDMFSILGGTDFDSFWRADVPAFSWLLPSDPNATAILDANNSAHDLKPPAVQSNINPLMRLGVNANVANLPGLNLGMNTVGIIQQLILKFGTLILLTYVIRSLIDQIPVIASAIASGSTGIGMGPTEVEKTIKKNVVKLENKATGGGR